MSWIRTTTIHVLSCQFCSRGHHCRALCVSPDCVYRHEFMSISYGTASPSDLSDSHNRISTSLMH
ncbi:hypothetical protein BDR07DRAFT_1390729, partial [Suillus spraguei]